MLIHSMPPTFSAAHVTILREVYGKGYITKRFELMHKCKIRVLISYICVLVQNVL